jgi:hypothetical protein
LRANLNEHCIPETIINGDVPDYDTFLEQRRMLIAAKIKAYFRIVSRRPSPVAGRCKASPPGKRFKVDSNLGFIVVTGIRVYLSSCPIDKAL